MLDARPGETIGVGELPMTLLAPYPRWHSSPTGRGNRLWRARVEGDLRALLDRHGRPIAYGYLDRRYPLATYQNVFAHVPGSAEMASAGRPFTEALLTRLVARGIGVAPVTLHTGVSSQEAGEGPQPEWYDVPATTARLVELTRDSGGRVVATGTTVTRALESAVRDGVVSTSCGWTERVVTPADPPVVVDGLITGWHDAGASHLLLVEAVAGTALAQAAYDAALAAGYRWHEFGDSALLLPGGATGEEGHARDIDSGVLGVLAGDEEDNPARDRDGVVGDPLVVAAEQGDVDGRLDAVLPVRAEQLAEGVAAQLVHLLVDLLELLGGAHVGVRR